MNGKKIIFKFLKMRAKKLSRSKTVAVESALQFIGKSGVVEPYDFIKVDKFHSSRKTIQVFILSHMHEDHLGGLTRGDYNAPDTEWSHGSIYCSEITYRLMLLRFPNLKPFMIPLEFNKDYTIESVTVRLIDANHCPGAAMILIKGSKGTVLHTGDFRYNGSKMIQDIGLSKIDYLYLDNTFSTPTEDFPAQSEAVHVR